MSLALARRASALGLALALAIAGTAVADTLTGDADALAGVQTSIDLGEVVTGSNHTVVVDFVLVCKGSSHLTAGATVTVGELAVTVPGDGALTLTPGSVGVPADWPASGGFCTGAESAPVVTPARLDLTAPTTAGTDRTFDVLFALSPEEEFVTNAIAVAVTMDVVEPAPVDGTPPTLHGMPGDITVQAAGEAAVVDYPMPTAADDTDPDPSVACDPASGSAFPIGETTVTCTATDASGNEAQATFTITVEATPAGVPVVATWLRPLADAVPALVGNAGRTIPLRLVISTGGGPLGPAGVDAPWVRVERLAGCAEGAPASGSAMGGSFDWSDGVWQHNLDTGGMGAGCVLVTASLGGEDVASAVIRLTTHTTAAKRAR